MFKPKSSDILFVDPYSGIYINLPNMSLAYAATIYNAPVIDQHILPYPKDRFIRFKSKTLVISVRSFAYREAIRIAQRYAKKYSQAEIKSLDALDVQCCYPFLNFSEKFTINIDFSDSLPFPRYELFDSFNYLSTNWQIGLWHYPLLTSIGCPYQCSFCAARNRTYKMRSIDNCIEELRIAKEKYKIRSFEIIDDVFNLYKERVIEFCEKVAALKLSWLCSNGLRADRFDEEEAEALISAGCHTVGFGVESIFNDILEKIHKGEKIEQIEEAIKIAKKYFSEVKGYFIVGLPSSNYDKDLASILWAKKMGIKAVVSYYIPNIDKISFTKDNPEGIFFGSSALPRSEVYSAYKQREVYLFAKKYNRQLYNRQKLPLRLIYLTLKGFKRYNLNSLYTILMIGPKRFLRILFKGEIQ